MAIAPDQPDHWTDLGVEMSFGQEYQDVRSDFLKLEEQFEANFKEAPLKENLAAALRESIIDLNRRARILRISIGGRLSC